MPDAAPRPSASPPPPSEHRAERWLDDHGDALFRFARIRVGGRDVAEDLVQDTLLAALNARDAFAGASSERTWLIGILKRKVVDHFRRQMRGEGGDAVGPAESASFDRRGCWASKVTRWSGSPESLLRDAEFRAAVDDCLSGLPDRLRAALTMRELDETPPEEVCKVLDVTPTNLWTLIHRARNRMRECLSARWFKEER